MLSEPARISHRFMLYKLESIFKLVIIDVDSSDDPTHGHHQLSLFHGDSEGPMYHPLLAFDGHSGFPMAVVLRPGNSHASRAVIEVLSGLPLGIPIRSSSPMYSNDCVRQQLPPDLGSRSGPPPPTAVLSPLHAAKPPRRSLPRGASPPSVIANGLLHP
jgi:hypothetical protein